VTILREAGLLTDHAMMAHGIHLTTDEETELGRLGTAIAHCPLSNFFFGHGVVDVLDVLDTRRCRVGLGTDVAGGYSPSMLSAMRNAVITNHVVDILRLQERALVSPSESAASASAASSNAVVKEGRCVCGS
jgi:guanine deaminase